MTESVAGAIVQPIATDPKKNQSPSGQYCMSGLQASAVEDGTQRDDRRGEPPTLFVPNRARASCSLPAPTIKPEGERQHPGAGLKRAVAVGELEVLRNREDRHRRARRRRR